MYHTPGRSRPPFFPPRASVSVALLAQCLVAPAAADDWNLRAVRADAAYASGKRGAGVLVGVPDSGIYRQDPAFLGRIDPGSRHFRTHRGEPLPATPADAHGSMVAGVLAANGQNGDVRGVAPLARLQVLQTAVGKRDSTNAAIRYAADTGVQALNISFGPAAFPQKYVPDRMNPGYHKPNRYYFAEPTHWYGFDPERGGMSDAPRAAAIEYAIAHDVLVVVAAGNNHADQPVQAGSPSGIGLLPYIAPENHGKGVYGFLLPAPAQQRVARMRNNWVRDRRSFESLKMSGNDPRLARLDYSHLKKGIIAVVATDHNNLITDYSNRCGVAWQWCIAAPDGAYTTDGGEGIRLVTGPGERSTRTTGGTSIATPHVTGAVAIVRSEFPFLTAAQTQEVILTTANNQGHLADRAIYGRGLLDVERAARGPGEFGAEGYGKVFDVDTKGHDAVFSNAIKGEGGLTKRGEGTLALSGANTYRGDTTVAGGTLKVTGSAPNSGFHVLEGGTLTGSGTVGATVSSGVIAPGGRTGKVLTVAGDFTQLPQGSVVSTLAGDGTLPHLAVTGKASLLGGTLLVNGVQSSLLGKQYTLIDAGNGVTGAFDRVLGDAAPLFSVVNTRVQGQRLIVSVDRNPGGFGAVAGNDNQRAVGQALDALRAGAPVFEHLFNTVDAGTARGRLARLVGDIHPSVAGMLAGQQARTRDILLDAGAARLVDASHAMPPAGASDARKISQVWGQYLNGRGQQSGDGNAAGLRHQDRGMIFGADAAVSAHSRLGGALAFGHGSARAQGSAAHQHADIGRVALAAYGATQAGRTRLGYGTSFGSHDVRTRRATDFGSAKARYKARTAQVYGEVGLPYAIGGTTVEPYAGIAYDHVRTQSFKESGAGPANLQGRASTQGNVSNTLGVRARSNWDLGAHGKLSIHGQVGWRHVHGKLASSTRMRLQDTASFTTRGLPADRDALLVNAGATWRYHRNGAVSLGYGGTYGKRAQDHAVRADLSWRF